MQNNTLIEGVFAGLATSILLVAFLTLTPAANAAPANSVVRQACMADAQQLCSKNFGNPVAVQGCMRANRGKLSAGCTAALSKRRGEALAVCKKRLLPKVQGLGREKAVATVRSCVMAEMRRR